MNLGHDEINDSRSRAQGFEYYECLEVMNEINESGSGAKGSEYYE